MRIRLALFFAFITTFITAQQKFSKEISFVNDNDLYASIERDQYYSNGMFLSYRYLASDFKRYSKKIYEIRAGHEMYSPFRSTVVSPLQHDRPFAAHLFGSFGVTRVYKNEKIFKTSLLMGLIGEDALGRELQEFIHDIYNFRAPVGWRYQIRNMLSLNIDALYIDALGTNESEHIDINFVGKARLGLTFNEVSAGFKGRFGFKKLQPLDNSIAFNTHLNNENTAHSRGIESFLYHETTLSWIAYDATMQGSLFNNNSPITFAPNSFRFDFELGYRFTSNRWNLGYAFHFQSNARPNLRNDGGHFYGRIFLGFLFD
jgi:hypothetical protein